MHQVSESVFRFSQRGYYLSFIAIVFAVIVGYLLGKYTNVDKTSETAIALQSLVFIVLMISLPGVLWWFNRQSRQLPALHPEEMRVASYKRLIILRFIVVNLNIVLNGILFFVFADKSFFMCAAIAAVFLLFCRPGIGNIEKDLGLIQNEDSED